MKGVILLFILSAFIASTSGQAILNFFDGAGPTTNCSTDLAGGICYFSCVTCITQYSLSSPSSSNWPECNYCVTQCNADCRNAALCTVCIASAYSGLAASPLCTPCTTRTPPAQTDASVVVPAASDCNAFCTMTLTNCDPAGAYAIYPDMATCMANCSAFPTFPNPYQFPITRNRNSLQCRAYHANLASVLPQRHCAHLGSISPQGGGCPDLTCSAYCDRYFERCSGGGRNEFNGNYSLCLTTCGNYATTPAPIQLFGVVNNNGESDGSVLNDADTLQCRDFYLWQTSQIPSFACPLAGPTGGGRCSPGNPFATSTRQGYIDGTAGMEAVMGLLYLSSIRDRLFKYNLIDPYITVGDPRPPAGPCSTPAETKYRTADGSCNNLALPAMGMAGTRMGRSTTYSSRSLTDPDPIAVARLMNRYEGFIPSPFLNLIAVAWIQFMTHDWFIHQFDASGSQLQIPIVDEGPNQFLNVPPTVKDNGYAVNGITHWWDASQLYGSSTATVNSLRTMTGGKLTMTGGLLPLPPGKSYIPHSATSGVIPMTGASPNWWLGLELMHTLWALEHNSVCDALAAAYPAMTDEDLFQTARLVISALLAKIHTIEWTPAVLQNPTLVTGLNANWMGINLNTFTPVDLPQTPTFNESSYISTLAPFFGNSPGLAGVGDKTYLAGVPFWMSEEFTAVYRMHPLLPEKVTFTGYSNGTLLKEVQMPGVLFSRSRGWMENYDSRDLWYSFGLEKAGHLTLFNYPNFLTSLEMDSGRLMNVAVMDVIRDRERNLPGYNDFRRSLGLTPITNFTQLNPDPTIATLLEDVYGGDVEAIDLIVGQLAEDPRPSGFGFSESTNQIFIIQASRRLFCDRFYQEAYRNSSYTDLGLSWVRNNTMKSVIARHFPELAGQMNNGKSAFEPWVGFTAQPMCPCPTASSASAAASGSSSSPGTTAAGSSSSMMEPNSSSASTLTSVFTYLRSIFA